MNTNAMFSIGYGLYVCGTHDGQKPTGCIINTATQLCAEPVILGVAVNKANYTHDVIMETKKLTISCLDESVPFDVFTRFGFQSGRNVDKFDGFDDFTIAANGTPYLTKYTNAYISGQVINTVDLPTHTLFITAIDDAEILSNTPTVTYSYYFAHIKPKPAPAKKKGWVCKICGYVYEGDELPEDFVCPLCKHGAADFEELKVEEDAPAKNVNAKYNVRKINDDYWYVGGNDRRLELFENVYPIPYGVSYNSYLLMDDKTVLFDTVDAAIGTKFFDNIEHVLDGRSLDYVIVNHMEPDHCATLGDLILHYPNVKVVTNKQVVTMIKQFFNFDIDSRAVLVDEGDTFTAGKHTLTFVKAPMVHWPEVMMTYDITDQILFSADAFGTFGALEGNVFSSETRIDEAFWDEARRYYTNIVGKYGPQVTNVLNKASQIDIKMICPLHGPIWDQDLNLMIEHTAKWAGYEPEVKGVMIAYGTIYGGTGDAAEVLANELSQLGVKNIKVYDTSKTDPSYILSDAFKYSHLVFASSSYNAGLFTSMQNLLHDIVEHQLKNRTAAILENGTWAPSAKKTMLKILEPLKTWNIIDLNITIKSRMNMKNREAIEALAKQLADDINQ